MWLRGFSRKQKIETWSAEISCWCNASHVCVKYGIVGGGYTSALFRYIGVGWPPNIQPMIPLRLWPRDMQHVETITLYNSRCSHPVKICISFIFYLSCIEDQMLYQPLYFHIIFSRIYFNWHLGRFIHRMTVY